MIVKEELLKKLRASFDLNIYEVKIWTALLCRGVATAGELSDISQIPRSRSYDVLDSLEKKGFVMMKLGKPIKYLAIKPEEIIRRIKDQVKDNIGSSFPEYTIMNYYPTSPSDSDKANFTQSSLEKLFS